MSDVVRVSSSEKWAYLPVGSQAYSHLLRFAKDGFASAGPSEIRLHSESGPIFWELIDEEKSSPKNAPILLHAALMDDGIGMLSGEELRFGRHDGAEYNGYADLSWLRNPSLKSEVPLAEGQVSEGDIVLTAWPSDRAVVPALVGRNKRELTLELAEARDKGDRCFVADENGKGIMSVSLSCGGDTARILPSSALDSWLFSVGTKAVRAGNRRFSVSSDGSSFTISDNKTNRRFRGAFKTRQADEEKNTIEFMLSYGGLASVLENYALRNA